MKQKLRILITGGSGFIGKELINKLYKRNIQTLSLSRKYKKKQKNIEWIKSSLKINNKSLNKIRYFKPNIVVHLAWENIPDFSKKMCNINLQNTKFFFNKILKLKSIEKIIVSGSCFEYKSKNGIKKEYNKINTSDNFPNTKNIIYEFLKKKCKKSQKIAWFRIFYAYGPGQRKESLIPYIINCTNNKKTIEIKTPFFKNDFIYVGDIINVISKSFYVNFKSGIYNLGSGIGTETKKIIEIIEKIKKIKINFNLNKNSKTKKFVASMNKTKKTFKHYNFVNIKTGLKKTLLKI